MVPKQQRPETEWYRQESSPWEEGRNRQASSMVVAYVWPMHNDNVGSLASFDRSPRRMKTLIALILLARPVSFTLCPR